MPYIAIAEVRFIVTFVITQNFECFTVLLNKPDDQIRTVLVTCWVKKKRVNFSDKNPHRLFFLNRARVKKVSIKL